MKISFADEAKNISCVFIFPVRQFSDIVSQDDDLFWDFIRLTEEEIGVLNVSCQNDVDLGFSSDEACVFDFMSRLDCFFSSNGYY